eukprot:990813-Amphidinium_carterae.1
MLENGTKRCPPKVVFFHLFQNVLNGIATRSSLEHSTPLSLVGSAPLWPAYGSNGSRSHAGVV